MLNTRYIIETFLTDMSAKDFLKIHIKTTSISIKENKFYLTYTTKRKKRQQNVL